MRNLGTISLMTLFVLMTAGSAAAQSSNLPGEGTRSISFGLPGDQGSGSFGIWTMLNEKVNLGLNLGLGISNSRTEGTTTAKGTSFSIGPALRYYTAALGPVAPFLYGQGDFHYGKDTLPAPERSDKGFGLTGGLGAEWFPVRNIGIAGFTGLRLARTSSTREPISSSSFSFGTLTSGLSFNIYFGGQGAEVAARR
jgi:hypothetical protein